MASQQSPPKRPRLSLQIQTSPEPPARPRKTHSVDPKDPTAFNTLSNAYVTAVERSTPLTAINTLQAFSLASPVEHQDSKPRVNTPYVANYPETPVSANTSSPRPMEVIYPSTMTATPPLSGTRDPSESKVFTFPPGDGKERPGSQSNASEPRMTKARVATHRTANGSLQLPYTQPQILHSILRNSPLPPRTAIPPPSPRRQSLRLQEKAARRVGYNSPLEQEIVTNKYTKSHIDLLAEEASPCSPSVAPTTSDEVLDLALAFTPNEIQDGGQTPGPFEETRRRMAGLSAGTPSSPSGIRKRKRREKKRQWVWTIGQEEDDEDVGGAIAALRAEAARNKKAQEESASPVPMDTIPQISYTEVPTPSVESSDSAWSEPRDVEMTDSSSIASEDRLSLPPSEGDIELDTPTGPKREPSQKKDTPIPELSSESRKDTPIPPDQLGQQKLDEPGPQHY